MLILMLILALIMISILISYLLGGFYRKKNRAFVNRHTNQSLTYRTILSITLWHVDLYERQNPHLRDLFQTPHSRCGRYRRPRPSRPQKMLCPHRQSERSQGRWYPRRSLPLLRRRSEVQTDESPSRRRIVPLPRLRTRRHARPTLLPLQLL